MIGEKYDWAKNKQTIYAMFSRKNDGEFFIFRCQSYTLSLYPSEFPT